MLSKISDLAIKMMIGGIFVCAVISLLFSIIITVVLNFSSAVNFLLGSAVLFITVFCIRLITQE